MNRKLDDPNLLIQTAWKLMNDRGRMAPKFIDLQPGTFFPLGFYQGRGGVWLSIDRGSINSRHRPVTYESHNADTSTDREWLLKAFQSWVTAASGLLYQE